MTEFRRPGKYEHIQEELRAARKRVEARAMQWEREREPGAPETMTPHHVLETLGPYISPRIEDHEKIIQAAHLLAQERIRENQGTAARNSKAVQEQMTAHLKQAIEHNALFRAPAIGNRGGAIRRRLQEFTYRARGGRGERLEIVGRGENKTGYLENQERLVAEHADKGTPFGVAVEKYGHPTDRVMKYRTSSLKSRNRAQKEPTTWLMEVEPSGLKHLAKKTRTLHDALTRRFYVTGAISARQARRLRPPTACGSQPAGHRVLHGEPPHPEPSHPISPRLPTRTRH